MSIATPEASRGNQPLPAFWRRPQWTDAGALAGAYAVLLVYGTLLPFHFELHDVLSRGWVEAARSVLTSPRYVEPIGVVSRLGVPAWWSDVVVNLALYAPLGVLLRLALGRWCGAWVAVAVGAVAASGLSWLLECAQSLCPGRYASLNDWWLNSAGGAAGAAVALRLRNAGRAVVVGAHRRWAGWLAAHREGGGAPRYGAVVWRLASLGILAAMVVCLAPALTPGRGSKVVHWAPFLTDFRKPYDVAAAELGESAAVFAAVALVLAVGEARFCRRQRPWWTVAGVTLAAAIAEAFSYASYIGSFDVTEPVVAACASAAALAVMYGAVYAVRRSCRRRAGMPVAVERRRRAHDYGFAVMR